jgi:inulin fructotransferase (DFA-I-forming)
MSEIQDDIILQQQTNQDDKGLRPGATIFIPAGRYRLQTTFVITINYLVIQGAGHGWMSQASRDAPDTDSSGWLETAPGASFIELDTSSTLTAIKIERDDFATTGRISGVELRDFCIGLVVATNPYNTSGTKGSISRAIAIHYGLKAWGSAFLRRLWWSEMLTLFQSLIILSVNVLIVLQ